MNRIITILVTIFILLLLYIWISHVWGSDKPKHPRQIVDATEADALGVDDGSGDVDSSLMAEPAMEMEQDLPDGGEETMTAIEETPEEEIIEEPKKEEIKPEKPVKTEARKPAQVNTAPAKPTSPPATKTSHPITKPTQVPANGDGKHLVIVGNFLQLTNANQRMQELKKAGFGDVEIVNFDLSEYHTVCAGRFDDVNEACRLVKKLKDYHKIDAYVRIGS